MQGHAVLVLCVLLVSCLPSPSFGLGLSLLSRSDSYLRPVHNVDLLCTDQRRKKSENSNAAIKKIYTRILVGALFLELFYNKMSNTFVKLQLFHVRCDVSCLVMFRGLCFVMSCSRLVVLCNPCLVCHVNVPCSCCSSVLTLWVILLCFCPALPSLLGVEVLLGVKQCCVCVQWHCLVVQWHCEICLSHVTCSNPIY